MLFGEIAAKLGYVSQKKIDEALLHQKKYLPSKKIGEILLFMGCLDEKQIEVVLESYEEKQTKRYKYSEIERYNIEETIGSGGFGVVYRAYDTKLNRIVALKMTNNCLTSVDDLKEEARSLATLNHRNIVQVHDFGNQGDKTYIVMEYVRGENITQSLVRLQQHKNYLKKSLDLALQVVEALVYLEKKGLCHQDIKPQNIIVDYDNHVKLVDFGLATTTTQKTVGNKGYTPRYTAPERLNLQIKPSIVSDIYSFGNIMLDLINPGEEHTPENIGKALAKLLPNNNSEKQRRLLSICQKCLEQDPNNRYQSAIPLYADLLDFYGFLQEDDKEFPYLYLLNAEVLFYLKKPRNYIGRSVTNDFILHNEKVSRVQLCINVDNYIVTVENLSQNGNVLVCPAPQKFPRDFPSKKVPTTKKILKQNPFIPLKMGETARLNNKSLIKIEGYLFCFIEEISFMKNRFCKTTSTSEALKPKY